MANVHINLDAAGLLNYVFDSVWASQRTIPQKYCVGMRAPARVFIELLIVMVAWIPGRKPLRILRVAVRRTRRSSPMHGCIDLVA